MIDENDAKRLLVDRLLLVANEDHPFAIAERIFVESKDVFIVEGIVGSCHEDFKEGTAFYAVNKEDGKVGLLCPPPGTSIDQETLDRSFVWDTWVVDKVVVPGETEGCQAEA